VAGDRCEPITVSRRIGAPASDIWVESMHRALDRLDRL
jgi:hypothetical protein